MKVLKTYSVKLVKEKSALYDIEDNRVTSPESVARIIQEALDLENATQEHFVTLALNTKNKVIGIHTIHIGTLNMSVVHPRDVLQRVILNNASAFICVHNHPSGDTKPSSEDFNVTDRLVEASKIIGIDFLDHIIVGEGLNYTSLKEIGKM